MFETKFSSVPIPVAPCQEWMEGTSAQMFPHSHSTDSLLRQIEINAFFPSSLKGKAPGMA